VLRGLVDDHRPALKQPELALLDLVDRLQRILLFKLLTLIK
jgi:hypothetical protein